MKLNIVAIRIWLITSGLILFSLIATSLFYAHFYSEQIKQNYLNDYESFMQNVEELSNSDPDYIIEYLQEANVIHSKLNFAMRSDSQDVHNEAEWNLQFSDDVYQRVISNPKLVADIEANQEIHVRSDSNPEYKSKIPYIFHIKHIEYQNEQLTFYAYADLSFVAAIERTVAIALVILILFSIFLSYLYYLYLRRNISEPINAMTNIAFDYARDDFSHQLPVSGRDDLSELAMAMNKMGHSLETNRTVVRQEKELLSHIMTSIDTGILYYDSDQTLILSNPAGELFLTQYQVEKGNFSSKDDYVDIELNLKEAVETKKFSQFNIEMVEFYYEVTILPLIEDDTLEIRGILVSTKDLTHEHRLDKMRVDFINNISHELRTPLVMVQGYSEAIIDDIAETIDEKKEMAQIISDESQRMNRMVNEMLDLSRMEAGFIEIEKDSIDLNRYLSTLVARFKKMASEVNVTINLDVPDETILLSIDKDKMDQVFVNLINNAIRHTGMTDKAAKTVTLRLFEDTNLEEIILEVSDTGTGIPKEDVPYIFDRFFKADKSRKNYSDNATGTGIGLSVVQSIIEAHGGRLSVESTLGRGSTFIIHLPIHPDGMNPYDTF
ncbi:HAMP domain-containing sensor histidine kinase [Marinilactibacillus kalidii]|uniref:HAMP domain-containing sensor histidine kinase n=1 Tax=Marinilactibacillus kalidii TaxID=2820274 RepID=UPI001ABE9E86|nr:ATP-binding protein [Marinilactibacillus kalidii]